MLRVLEQEHRELAPPSSSSWLAVVFLEDLRA
jgi:hypothetical protein